MTGTSESPPGDRHVRVVVNRDACSGHGLCATYAPEVFELDDVGYSVPREELVAPELAGAARRGETACPERAITVEETDIHI